MNNELYHHGVKGMKWGVRRYQNSDGTRTDAGKKHEAKLAKKAKRVEKRQTLKAIAEERKYKNPKKMTDDEIRQRIARLKLENEYKTLSGKNVERGKKEVNDVLKSSIKKSAEKQLTNAFNRYGAMAFDSFAAKNDDRIAEYFDVKLDEYGYSTGPFGQAIGNKKDKKKDK